MLRFTMMSGEYIHISEAAQCPAVQDLTVKVDSLTAANFKLQGRNHDIGGELMERAEVEQELQEHIRAAFVAAGFTETEWVALYNFKCNCNEENHVQFQITKAYDIVTRITSASYIDDLKSGLNKAIAFHEACGGNWMQLYPY